MPLLVIGAAGIFLWRQSNAPERRELTLSIVGLGQARSIDLQILGPDGALVQREERYFSSGEAPIQLLLESPLQRGTHQLRAFASLPDGGSGGVAQTPLEVQDEEALRARLWFQRAP